MVILLVACVTSVMGTSDDNYDDDDDDDNHHNNNYNNNTSNRSNRNNDPDTTTANDADNNTHDTAREDRLLEFVFALCSILAVCVLLSLLCTLMQFLRWYCWHHYQRDIWFGYWNVEREQIRLDQELARRLALEIHRRDEMESEMAEKQARCRVLDKILMPYTTVRVVPSDGISANAMYYSHQAVRLFLIPYCCFLLWFWLLFLLLLFFVAHRMCQCLHSFRR